MRGYIKENLDKFGKVISFRIGAPLGKDPVTGKHQYHFETVKTDSIGIARKRLREVLTELDKGVFIKPDKAILAQYLGAWLADYVKPNLAHKTHQLYSYICDKHIIPTLGNIPIAELRPPQLQHLYTDKLQSGLSGRTVQLIHITLHKALKNGVKIGLLIRNVAEAVDSPKVKRHEMKTLSEDDLHVFLDLVKDSEYFPLFHTYLHTGMRRSELLAVQWFNVDLFGCLLSVTRSMEYIPDAPAGERISFKSTKTAKSRRLIDLTPSNAIVLREHRENQNKIRQSLNLPAITDNDLVFSHVDGSPYLPNSVTHAWIKAVRRTGFKGIRLHDARHSHASILMLKGVHPKIVSERLGHAGIAITLDLYSHVVAGMQRAAAAKFDEVTSPKESKLDKELKEIIK